MSDAFIGEIRMFGGQYAPYNWAFCDGQSLQPATDAALYSLLGIAYGGDGRVTFKLPDMRSRIPMHYGTGPGLSPRPLGMAAGSETVTLATDQIPAHTHNLQCSTQPADSLSAQHRVPAQLDASALLYDTSLDQSKMQEMAADIIENAGSGAAHPNWMPSLGIQFIVCRVGTYPQRNT